MNTDSNTPETDSSEFPVMTWPSRDNPMVVRSTLARQLETENGRMRKLIPQLLKALKCLVEEAARIDPNTELPLDFWHEYQNAETVIAQTEGGDINA